MMNTEPSMVIGMAILSVALIIATAQRAFALGCKSGATRERQLADRRVNGVLAYENARRPKAQKNKRKAVRRGKLARTIVAHGISLPV